MFVWNVLVEGSDLSLAATMMLMAVLKTLWEQIGLNPGIPINARALQCFS